MTKGVVCLNKSGGWTSRDAVNKVRNLLHVRDAGHMGTLDPQGTGVLLIGVGKATRLFDLLLGKDKVYEADFTFGYETDTLDGDGTVTSTCEFIPSEGDVLSILPEFIGKISQLPPAYSAKNVGGVRAYDLARKGKSVELTPAEVEIFSVDLLRAEGSSVRVRVHCSAGTYIRSLCRDVAHALGSLATMTSITRTRCGEFTIENSLTVADVERLGERAVIPLEEVLSFLPRFDADYTDYDKLKNGARVPAPDKAAPFTVYCRGELFGLGEKLPDGTLKIRTYLRD